MISPQYIAGFFDGEGSVFCTSTGYVAISITQRRPKVLYAIQSFLGYGRIVSSKGAKIHMYRITRRDQLRMFLILIQPYLIEKEDQVRLAIKMLDYDRDTRKRYAPLLKELKK